MPYSNAKRIGRRGEKAFEKICADRPDDIVFNSSTDDERGWDYFVEFPSNSTSNTPTDMTATGSKVLVQIKTQTRCQDAVRIKLSNAFEFAKCELPAFIVLFILARDNQLAQDTQIKEVYLLHFWEPQIERTLKRVRQLDSVGRHDLHNVSISFPVKEFLRSTPSELFDKIQEIISGHDGAYSAHKRELAERTGFQNGAIRCYVEFKPGTTLDRIVDSQIGIEDELEVSRFTGHSIRFGLPSGKPTFSFADGKLQIRPRPRSCTVKISSEVAGKEVSLKSELLAPAFPGLPQSHWRLRITNPYLDLVLNHATNEMTFHLTHNGTLPQSIAELLTTLELIRIYATGSAHITVYVENQHLADTTAPISGFQTSATFEEVEKFVKLISSVPEHDVPTGFRCSLAHLWERVAAILYCNELATGGEIEGSFACEWQIAPYEGAAHAVAYNYVQLPRYVVYLIVRRHAEILSPIDGRSGVHFGAVQYCRVRILSGTHAQNHPLIAQEAEAFGKVGTRLPVLVTGLVEGPSEHARTDPS